MARVAASNGYVAKRGSFEGLAREHYRANGRDSS
jgi:hypothetical protein